MLPGGYVEVRAIQNGRVKQWWEKDRQAASDLALQLSDDGWDSYFGVLPRRVHGDGTGGNIAPVTRTLWADLDDKVHGTKADTLRALVKFNLCPSVVVDSGHGYHAYWRLASIVHFQEARYMMVGLAKQLKGDHVYDNARILRVPGTTNWKDIDKPMPVRAILFNTTTVYDVGAFAHLQDIGYDKEHPAPRPRPSLPDDFTYDLPDWLNVLIDEGVPQGQRSEACWKVMCRLGELGWNDDDIRRAFDTGAIGEKMREQNDGGDRWFQRSLDKARAQL